MNKTSLRLGDAEVARIGLGSNRLTFTPDHVGFIRAAVNEGIGHVDTAHLYTGGESERTIGAALSAVPADAVVATKGGFRQGEGRPEVLRDQIDQSLLSLRTNTIDLYYLHRVDPDTPLEESFGALKECRDAGKIRHVGISEVTVDQIERARRVVPIAAVQNHYNFAQREHEPVVDYCEQEGIVFVPFFPLRAEPPPSVRAIAERHGATTAQITLAWLLHRSPAMLPIPGTLSLEHAKANLKALEIELSDDEFRALS